MKATIAETANYNGGETTADFTIGKRAITVKADDKSSQYGAALQQLTWSVSSGTLVNDSDINTLGITAGTGATSASDVGEYSITLSGGSANGNYAVTLAGGKYTITRQPLTVTASGYSGTYDGTAHGITVDVGTSGATVYYAATELTAENYTTGSTANLTYTDAGTHTVYYFVYSGNYEPNPVKGSQTVSIDKAAPTYSAPTGLTATYGQTLADVTLTNPTGNTEGTWAWVDATTTSVGAAGSNTFKANFTPTDTTNYNTVENVNVTVTVAKAVITPSVSIEGWTYGDAAKTPIVTGNPGNGAVTYTYKKAGSLVPGAPVDGFTAGVPTAAGSYTVKATIAETANYNGGETTADFTIAKKAATVTADGKTKVFGESNPALTATATDLVGSDTLNYTLSRAVGESAGEYAITVTLGENPNYDVTATNGIFTITKKTVTVTPDAKSKTYGDANPALTATVTGLVEGEPAFYTLERTAGEDVGQYTISVKPGENANYVIDGKTAVLTVEPRSLTEAAVKAEPDSFDYDGQEKAPQITVTWNGKVLEMDKDYVLSGFTTAKDFGTYEFTVTGKGNFKDAVTTTWNIAGEQEANTSTETDDNGRTVTGAVNVSPDTPATTATVDTDFAKAQLDGTEPAGAKVDVYLEVEKTADVDNGNKTALENEAAGKDNSGVGMFLDLNLYKKVGSAAAEEIATSAAPVSVTMTVPADVRAAAPGCNRSFSVYCSVNGAAPQLVSLPTAYNAATGQITFSASQFDTATQKVTYALVYTDTPKNSSNYLILPNGSGVAYGLAGVAAKAGVKSARTGDSGISLYVALLGVSAILGAAVIGDNKRRTRG